MLRATGPPLFGFIRIEGESLPVQVFRFLASEHSGSQRKGRIRARSAEEAKVKLLTKYKHVSEVKKMSCPPATTGDQTRPAGRTFQCWKCSENLYEPNSGDLKTRGCLCPFCQAQNFLPTPQSKGQTMQKKEPEMSLFCIAIWFGLLWVAYRYFPAGWVTPWNFSGRLSFLLSCAIWTAGTFGSLGIMIAYLDQDAKPVFQLEPPIYIGTTFGGLVCIGLIAIQHYINCGSLPPLNTAVVEVLAASTNEKRAEPAEMLDNEQSLGLGMEKLRIEQEKLGTFITEMEHERTLVVSRLRQAGVSSNKDLEGNAEGQVYAQELLEIERTLRAMRDRARAQSLMLTKAESLLRKIGRQNRLKEVGLDSQAPEQFAQLRVEIDEMLRPDSIPSSNVLQLDQVLREALQDQS